MVGPDDELIEQETDYIYDMTDGQQADYFAEQVMNEPDID